MLTSRRVNGSAIREESSEKKGRRSPTTQRGARSKTELQEAFLGTICDSLIGVLGYENIWAILTSDGEGTIILPDRELPNCPWQAEKRPKQDVLPWCAREALKSGGLIAVGSAEEGCSDCVLAGRLCRGTTVALRLEHKSKLYGVMIGSLPKAKQGEKAEHWLFAQVVEGVSLDLHRLASRSQGVDRGS